MPVGLALHGLSNASIPCYPYFLIASRPYSSADVLCKLIADRFPDASCAGELFAPKAMAAKAARSAAGFNIDRQKASPAAFMQAWQSRSSTCKDHLCGSVLMPFQLPNERLPALFTGRSDCRVRAVLLERQNRTAAYREFQAKAGGGSGGGSWSSMSFARFSEMHDDWSRRVSQSAMDGMLLKISSEDVLALASVASPPPSSTEAATLRSLAAHLGTAAPKQTSSRRSKQSKQQHEPKQSSARSDTPAVGGSQPQSQKLEAMASEASVLSAAGARAVTHAKDELATSQRNRRSRAVMLTAATAFAATCLSGTCFALGVAVGGKARHRRMRLARGDELPELPSCDQS